MTNWCSYTNRPVVLKTGYTQETNHFMYGWCLDGATPKEYPSYDSAGSLKPIELSRWVPKSFNLVEHMSKNLYFIERELTGEESTWRYSYTPVESNQEKESYISPFTFYEKFDLYNGIKHGQIIPILHQGKSSIKEKLFWIYVTWSTDSFLTPHPRYMPIKTLQTQKSIFVNFRYFKIQIWI